MSVCPSSSSIAIKVPPLVLIDVIDSANVGMIQGGRCTRLTLEPFQHLRILSKIVANKLQRHAVTEAQVFGFKDLPHFRPRRVCDNARQSDQSR
jgi:hypothetical protein